MSGFCVQEVEINKRGEKKKENSYAAKSSLEPYKGQVSSLVSFFISIGRTKNSIYFIF